MLRKAVILAALWAGLVPAHALTSEASIALPDVSGRIDHMGRERVVRHGCAA